MGKAGKIALPVLATVSAALCIAVIVLWICSHHWPLHFSFHTSQARYTLHSSDGDLIVAAPPSASNADVQQIENIARQMSADDLQPRMINSVSGTLRDFYIPRPDTPAGKLLDRCQPFFNRGDHRSERFAMQRTMLRAMEDPQRFKCALSVLFWSLDNVHDPDQGAPDHFPGNLVLLDKLPIGQPEPSRGPWKRIRDGWHDYLDIRVFRMCYAWAVAATLVLPFSWLAKPRRAKQSRARWVLNSVSLLGLLLSLAVGLGWVQSYRNGFQLSSLFPVHRDDDYVDYYFETNSCNGCMRFYFLKDYNWVEFGPQEETVLRPADQYYDAGLIARWKYSAIKHGRDSTAPLWCAAVIVRYWLMLLVSVALPIHWLVRCRRAPYPTGTCQRCGYDLRATPQRCPECGCVSAKDQLTTATMVGAVRAL